jgi:hypothetical protein
MKVGVVFVMHLYMDNINTDDSLYLSYLDHSGSPSDCIICVVRRKKSIFVAISIFHFGLLQPQDRISLRSLFPNHLRPGENHTMQGRIHLIKQFIKNLAPLRFPELNDLTPSLIVAHSSLWDLAILNSTNPTLVANFLPRWEQAMEEKFKSSIFLEFGDFMVHRTIQLSSDEYDTIQQMHPTSSNFIITEPKELSIPRLYMRTCPVPVKLFPTSVVKAMNHWITHSSTNTNNWVDTNTKTSNYLWGVLDWASLLQNSYTPTMAADGFHSNEQGLETFWKLIFSRLYVLSN